MGKIGKEVEVDQKFASGASCPKLSLPIGRDFVCTERRALGGSKKNEADVSPE